MWQAVARSIEGWVEPGGAGPSKLGGDEGTGMEALGEAVLPGAKEGRRFPIHHAGPAGRGKEGGSEWIGGLDVGPADGWGLI